MNKGQLVKTVNHNLKTKLCATLLLELYLFLLGAPIYIAIKSKNVLTTIFCLVFIGFFFWIIRKSKPIKYLTSAFNPAFAIYDKGLEINKTLFIEWDKVKEITIFEHFGEKHFGFRLKEEVTKLNGIDIEEYFKNELTWSVYKMPYVSSYHSLSPSSDKVIELIHSKFLAPVTKQKVSDELKFTEP
ncbi:MAG: hypothetical protein ACYS6W_00795 [Planctomycetota bacterium]|jgi:hypothetical protein